MDKILLTEPFLMGRPLEVWLDSMGITRWSINGGLVDVKCDVNLEGYLGELKRLPVRFGRVSGTFLCNANQLVSLEGAPTKVDGDFYCRDNQLVSLKGAPAVGGGIYCDNNQLISLEGAPAVVGGHFSCSYNQLLNLEGGPEQVGGNFDCSYNQLVSLDGAPEQVGSNFYCDNNQLESLDGSPKQLGGSFWCQFNRLESLKGALKVAMDFRCDHNLLVDFKGLEGVSIEGSLIVTDPGIAAHDNIFVSLEGLPKELYSKVIGLDILLALEFDEKRAASLLGLCSGVEELVSEVELG